MITAHDNYDYEGAWEEEEPDAERHAGQTSELCMCRVQVEFVRMY